MRPFVVGTAGHIDHGKSSLVKALTGIDPDRLPEEKRRGITIELGFAHGELSPGLHAAFVDVPGHERFVREMVAGAHGVDVVLLVVALDEGVMPQTREHAEICRLLGLSRAVVALTKSDLAPSLDPSWSALVMEDVRALGAPFDGAEVVPVSARTGEGLPQLRAALAKVSNLLSVKSTSQPLMMPIDRAFTLSGHGTVVTGTLVSGSISAGAALSLVVPAAGRARVVEGLRARSLQTHGRSVARATAGQRVAVNLPGIEVAQVSRGATLVAEGVAEAWSSALFDVELELAKGAAPVKNRAKLRLHLGTAQAMATVDLLGRAEIRPGETAAAQLRCDRALVGVRDQRFVLRGDRATTSSGRTVAGGRVLCASSRRRRAKHRAIVEALVSPDSAVHALAAEAGALGLEECSLSLRLGSAASGGGLVREGRRLFDAAAISRLVERLRAEVRARPGRSREEVRSSMGPGVAPEAFVHAVAQLGPEFVAGETLEVASRVRSALEERVHSLLVAGGRAPPTSGELAAQLSVTPYDAGAALRGLAKRGDAVKLTDELFVSRAAADDFRSEVVREIASRGPLTTLEIKAFSGVSRKYLIPLCEWLDREHVTLRVGEKRSLRKSP